MIIIHEDDASNDAKFASEIKDPAALWIGGGVAKKAYDYIKKKKDDKEDRYRKLKMVGAGLAGTAGAGLAARSLYRIGKETF